MVEASLVLPLVILSVITCLLVSMFFYETTMRQCQLHMGLRWEAGQITGHTVYQESPEIQNDGFVVSRSGIFRTVSGKEHIDMRHQGLIRSRVSADTESLWHASDGVTYVRHRALAKKLTEAK